MTPGLPPMRASASANSVPSNIARRIQRPSSLEGTSPSIDPYLASTLRRSESVRSSAVSYSGASASRPHLGAASSSSSSPLTIIRQPLSSSSSPLTIIRQPLSAVQIERNRIDSSVIKIIEYANDSFYQEEAFTTLKTLTLNAQYSNQAYVLEILVTLSNQGFLKAIDCLSDIADKKRKVPQVPRSYEAVIHALKDLLKHADSKVQKAALEALKKQAEKEIAEKLNKKPAEAIINEIDIASINQIGSTIESSLDVSQIKELTVFLRQGLTWLIQFSAANELHRLAILHLEPHIVNDASLKEIEEILMDSEASFSARHLSFGILIKIVESELDYISKESLKVVQNVCLKSPSKEILQRLLKGKLEKDQTSNKQVEIIGIVENIVLLETDIEARRTLIKFLVQYIYLENSEKVGFERVCQALRNIVSARDSVVQEHHEDQRQSLCHAVINEVRDGILSEDEGLWSLLKELLSSRKSQVRHYAFDTLGRFCLDKHFEVARAKALELVQSILSDSTSLLGDHAIDCVEKLLNSKHLSDQTKALEILQQSIISLVQEKSENSFLTLDNLDTTPYNRCFRLLVEVALKGNLDAWQIIQFIADTLVTSAQAKWVAYQYCESVKLILTDLLTEQALPSPNSEKVLLLEQQIDNFLNHLDDIFWNDQAKRKAYVSKLLIELLERGCYLVIPRLLNLAITGNEQVIHVLGKNTTLLRDSALDEKAYFKIAAIQLLEIIGIQGDISAVYRATRDLRLLLEEKNVTVQSSALIALVKVYQHYCVLAPLDPLLYPIQASVEESLDSSEDLQAEDKFRCKIRATYDLLKSVFKAKNWIQYQIDLLKGNPQELQNALILSLCSLVRFGKEHLPEVELRNHKDLVIDILLKSKRQRIEPSAQLVREVALEYIQNFALSSEERIRQIFETCVEELVDVKDPLIAILVIEKVNELAKEQTSLLPPQERVHDQVIISQKARECALNLLNKHIAVIAVLALTNHRETKEAALDVLKTIVTAPVNQGRAIQTNALECIKNVFLLNSNTYHDKLIVLETLLVCFDAELTLQMQKANRYSEASKQLLLQSNKSIRVLSELEVNLVEIGLEVLQSLNPKPKEVDQSSSSVEQKKSLQKVSISEELSNIKYVLERIIKSLQLLTYSNLKLNLDTESIIGTFTEFLNKFSIDSAVVASSSSSSSSSS